MRIRLRPLPDLATLSHTRRVTVADLLELPAFAGAGLLAGEPGLDGLVTHVNVMQVPTASFALAGDLVLAADEAFHRSRGEAARLLSALCERAVAAVAARRSALGQLPDSLLEVAQNGRLPLIQLPDNAHLAQLHAATLEALVANQASELRRSAAVRDQMTAFALSGGELEDLPAVVAELAGGEVAILAGSEVVARSAGWGDPGDALAASEAWRAQDGHAPAQADGGLIIWPLPSSGVALGCLVARLPTPLEAVRLAALEYGGNIAALNILHRREARRAENQLQDQLVHDLVSGMPDEDAARRRAAALGWEVQESFLVLLARGGGTSVAALIGDAQRAVPAAVAVEHRGACLAILPDEAAPEGQDTLIAALLRDRPDVHIGVSAPAQGFLELPAGLRGAEEALECAELFDARTSLRRAGELGALRLLLLVPRSELEQFATRTLSALDALEPSGEGALSATLALLLSTGLNLAETARRGSWHYNTVRYRAERLGQLLGPFMRDGTRLQTLSTALLVRRELGGP